MSEKSVPVSCMPSPESPEKRITTSCNSRTLVLSMSCFYIVDEFGDGLRCFKKKWEKFGYSQLCELLPLSDEQRKSVKPDWTVKQIREYKKSLVATSQQVEMELPEMEEPPKDKYARFEKWTKRELCDKIFDLEAQYDELLRENERLLHMSVQEMAG